MKELLAIDDKIFPVFWFCLLTIAYSAIALRFAIWMAGDIGKVWRKSGLRRKKRWTPKP
jgi:hypothetical protein